MSSKEGWNVVLTPFLIPVGLLESLTHLSLIIIGTLNVSNECFSPLVSFEYGRILQFFKIFPNNADSMG